MAERGTDLNAKAALFPIFRSKNSFLKVGRSLFKRFGLLLSSFRCFYKSKEVARFFPSALG